DNRFGGGQVRSAVGDYLDTAVAPLLREGRYDERTGRRLASAAAELTRLAGWMAYDLEQHGLAQRYLIQALSLARSAGDHALGGEILAGMSHQAVYIGRPDHALDLARAAQLSARRSAADTPRAPARSPPPRAARPRAPARRPPAPRPRRAPGAARRARGPRGRGGPGRGRGGVRASAQSRGVSAARYRTPRRVG